MTTIPANDSKIIYSPYNWDVDVTRARTITPGAYLRMTVDGSPTTLTANFDMTNVAATSVRVAFRVDGTGWKEYTLAASIALDLPAENTWPTRVVEMVFVAQSLTVERWAFPGQCALEFTGITADSVAGTRTTRRRPLNIVVAGDSITQGVRAKTSSLYPGYLNDDSRLGWGYPMGELLGAEVSVIGYAGAGISRSGSGSVPKFPLSIPYHWNGKARSYLSPATPDAIIAHLGTNDATSVDADVIADTTTLMNHWISATPDTPIFVLPGWMQRKAAQIQAGIAACSNPSRVQYIDTTGWWDTADSFDALHPYGYVHLTDLAPRVAAAVKPYIGGATAPPTLFVRSNSSTWVSV